MKFNCLLFYFSVCCVNIHIYIEGTYIELYIEGECVAVNLGEVKSGACVSFCSIIFMYIACMCLCILRVCVCVYSVNVLVYIACMCLSIFRV